MGKLNSRVKGQNAEREIARIFQGYGYDCHRGQGIYQKGGIDTADVVGLPGIHIECKRQENLNVHKAYEQATRDAAGKAIPAVFHRRNRAPWMVTLSLEDFMEIYEAWEKILE